MVYRMIFNQTAYFGRGAIKEIPGVAKSHGFTKAFIVTDPVLLESGVIQEVEHTKAGKLKVLANPVIMSETTVEYRPAPELGANTREVLAGLGYSEEEIETMKAAGAI